jgi:hypothetical protein
VTPQRGIGAASGTATRTGTPKIGTTRIVVTGTVAAVLGVVGTLLAIWRAAGG